MIKGFVLSAGLGERLRPITNYIPKPLLPILGKPIIDYAIERLLSVKVQDIGVNVHYRLDCFENWLRDHRFKENLKIFVEPEILGTAGALKNAEQFLSSSEIFITHNADIFTDLDISEVITAHRSGDHLATLAVVDYPEINSLSIDEDGFLVTDHTKPFYKKRTFTGIAIYSPHILFFIPQGYSSIVDAWKRAMVSGKKIKTFDITGNYWSDIGSVDRYSNTVFDILQSLGRRVYISKDFSDCQMIHYEGYLVIEEGCKIRNPSVLKNTIILPDTTILSGIETSCSVIFGDDVVSISDSVIQRPLGAGGSDRVFLRDTSQRVVKMYCQEGDKDFLWHIALTQYLYKRDIPVPRLLHYSIHDYTSTFEDVGDLSVYDWMSCQRGEDEVIEMYGQIIEQVIKLHRLSDLELDGGMKLREFDYEYLRWETDYFIEHFIRSFCKRDVDNEVYQDLDILAKKASSFKKTIVHRDLQSQNIMIRRDNTIRFVDYQSARLGPPAYDLASLCFDPYVRISDDLRERLCDIYIQKRVEASEVDEVTFRDSLTVCKMQRLMQALGAYSNLSINKGKKHFLQYIPEGLSLLKRVISQNKGDYPSLYSLIMGI